MKGHKKPQDEEMGKAEVKTESIWVIGLFMSEWFVFPVILPAHLCLPARHSEVCVAASLGRQ